MSQGSWLPSPISARRSPAGGWWLAVLDVGQGLSAVVRTQSHTLVYDAGPGWAVGADSGTRVILPYLRQAGITAIDRLILSHADQDHIGGYPALREGLPIHDILSGEAARVGTEARPCQTGQHWEWDGVRFTILHPPADYPSAKNNNHSCVLRVENAVASVLLPGDAEKSAESRMAGQFGNGLKSTLLVAGHHGSASSSSQDFLTAVQPETLLFSTGRHNRFHFPKPAVVARSQAIGANTWDTAVEGAIEFHCPAQGRLPGPRLFRRDHPHYWRESVSP